MFGFQLFTLLNTLVSDQEDQPKELEDNEDFIEEQNQVARLVHLIYNEDADSHFRVKIIFYLEITVFFWKKLNPLI